MDATRKRRFQFGLRTLLVAVALIGIALYFRPGQVHPSDVPIGASKAWVNWYCGGPDEADFPDWYDLDTWNYFAPEWVELSFDINNRVVNVYAAMPGETLGIEPLPNP